MHKKTTIVNKCNEGERRLFEYNYSQIGNFFNSLFQVMFKADNYNLNKLSLGYPEEVNAVKKYKTIDGYWDAIQFMYTEEYY